jgi:uncharacterized cupredoxin-like copper-binding protein
VSRALRTHRLVAVTVTVVLAVLGLGAVVLTRAGASDTTSDADVLGPGPVTVRLDVDHSRFTVRPDGRTPIRVRPHTEVRFVVVNHDPIGHELIVGGPEVQARHEGGHEASHPPVPGEVSVPAEGRAGTTYVFHEAGPVEYACHLPRHYAYGMHGIVEVVADRPTR